MPTAQAKIAKEYVLPTLSAERKIMYENTTKYIRQWQVIAYK